MKKRIFGKTGLEVTPLGFGSAELGFLGIPQSDCNAILNGILDLGINVIDTAASYMDSEEKVGAAVSHRRQEFVLITKCGQHIDPGDPPEWTPQAVRHSAERSLRRLKTDHLDLLLLHSCSAEKLRNQEMIDALIRCKDDGLTRFIGYSGDGANLRVAIQMQVFDCIETSVNFCDQQVIGSELPLAREANLGVIAKRPLANACWRETEDFDSFYYDYTKPYIDRLAAMDFTPESLGFSGDWAELALRFSAFQPGVHTAIIGGKNFQHIRQNIAAIEKGPLPREAENALREIWNENATEEWVGMT